MKSRDPIQPLALRKGISIYWPMRLLVGCFGMMLTAVGYAQPVCEVQRGRINDIQACDSIGKVFATGFQKDFEVTEIYPSYFSAIEKSTKRKWFDFSVDNQLRITTIDVEGPCLTKEGIGVGSTLADAAKVYGHPQVSPSDVGCYVGFKKLPWVAFLLSNDDLPKNPCRISDDEFTAKHVRQVLKYRKARIVAIHLPVEDSCPDHKGGAR